MFPPDIQTRRTQRPSVAAIAIAALTLAVAGSGGAWAATSAVYKCFDRNLNVLYTDVPCAGEQVDIRAGEADAGRVAELARERDGLSRSADQRIAEARRATLERTNFAQWGYPPPIDTGSYADAPDGWPYGYAVLPGEPRGHKGADRAHGAKPLKARRIAPAPPRVLPQK